MVLRYGDSLPHGSHSYEDVRAGRDHQQGGPAKVLLGVIEIFKAVERSSDVLAGIQKAPESRKETSGLRRLIVAEPA